MVQLSNLGFGMTLPVYFIIPWEQNTRYQGLYAGPNLMFSYDLLKTEFAFTTDAEVGYSFLISQLLGINAGAQLGATWFHNLPPVFFVIVSPHIL